MSRRGPAPKPREAKLLAGNPSRRPLPEPVIVGARQVAAPLPPARLSPEVAEVYTDLAELLTDAGYLVTGDLELLERLAFAIALVRRVEDELRDAELTVEGAKGGEVANPLLRIQRDAAKQVHSLCVEFGLSPSARARLGVTVATGATLARKLRDDDTIVTASGSFSRTELINEYNNRPESEQGQ